MNKERPFLYNRQILNSKAADLARSILPESGKRILKTIIYGERAKYPLPEPVMVNLAGLEAKFWIKNHSDWHRIRWGGFEKEYSTELLERIKNTPHPNFIDIGSAQGYYSLLAAKAGANVIAIDPDPISLNSIRENLLLNNDIEDRVRTLALGIGEKESRMTFYIDRRGIYAPSLKRTVKGLREEIEIPIRSLSSLILDEKIIPSPNIIKIDVEGAEGLVINGMRRMLSSENRPSDIFIEIHKKYLPMFGMPAEKVMREIEKYKYNLISHWDRRSEILCHFEG